MRQGHLETTTQYIEGEDKEMPKVSFPTVPVEPGGVEKIWGVPNEKVLEKIVEVPLKVLKTIDNGHKGRGDLEEVRQAAAESMDKCHCQ